MKKLFSLILIIVVPVCLTAQLISTIAGTGVADFSGDGGVATAAKLNFASGMTLDRWGNVYIADYNNHRVRKINITNQVISTIAGIGSAGYNGDSIPALQASLNHPSSIAVDTAGNIFIADTDNHRIRKIDADSFYISTVAGTGVAGYVRDGIPAGSTRLNGPTDVVLDAGGNIYIADQDNHRVRMVSKLTGLINTVAGNGMQGNSGDGDSAIHARLNGPTGICLDRSGNIIIADQSNNVVRKVSAQSALISRIAGTGNPLPFVFGGDGGLATNAVLFFPQAVAADTGNNIYIVDSWHNVVRKINAVDSIISTVAGMGGLLNAGDVGDGGPATSAKLNNPSGIALDETGNIFIADYGNHRIRKLTVPCIPTTYIFTGNGYWSDKANWLDKRRPPTVLPSCCEIIIRNLPVGPSILNYQQVILPGAKLTVDFNKQLIIPLYLAVQ